MLLSIRTYVQIFIYFMHSVDSDKLLNVYSIEVCASTCPYLQLDFKLLGNIGLTLYYILTTAITIFLEAC